MTAQELLRRWMTIAQLTPNKSYDIRISINNGRTFLMDFYEHVNDLCDPFKVVEFKHIKNGKVLENSVESSESSNSTTLFDRNS